VAEIGASKRRGFLRQIVEGAKASNTPLKQALLSAQASVNSPTFRQGRIVINQSGSGQSGSFQIPGNSVEWSQPNVYGMIEELIELLESVLTSSGIADDGTTQDALFAEMLNDDSTRQIRQQMGDFSMLNT
jgi:hypothetical protein